MPYLFTEHADGVVITHSADANIMVSLALRDTGLIGFSTRTPTRRGFGFFEYFAMAQWLVGELTVGRLGTVEPPPRKQAWFHKIIGRRIGKELHRQWKRLLSRADPTIVAVQRAIFAATFRAPDVLHELALYRDPWIVRDILAYRAAAIAACYLAAPVNEYPFDAPRVMDEATLAAYLQERAVGADAASAMEDGQPAYLVAQLQNWRGLFSPSGQPYTSLNRTLMGLPHVPAKLLLHLKHIRLERPVTDRLELLLLLTDHAVAYGVHHHQPIYMHATAEQIREALRRVAAHTRNGLRATRRQDLSFLVRFLNDYPERHRGTIVGLTDKSIAWHRRAQARVREQTIATLGGDQATASPPIALPDVPGIRFLATVREVVTEGAAMGHCIAAYARQAVMGTCYLFHIEHEGEVASVQVGRDGRVVQANGPRNQRNAAAAWGQQVLSQWGQRFPNGNAQALAGRGFSSAGVGVAVSECPF